MAESSFWWTTGGAGDGASMYTRQNLSTISKILGACTGSEGVAPGYLNALAGSVPAANTVRIASGAALADGKPYLNDASVDIFIPSASNAGYARIDRIVLRVDWAAQTARLTRIEGTEAVNPSAPAITQISGTTYDVSLYRALVDTSGNVTLTDERTMASNEFALAFVIGDGTNEITPGLKGFIEAPFSGMITRATIVEGTNTNGSCVVDVWRGSYANYPPTSADSICGSAKPTLSASVKQQDAVLNGWLKTFAAGDWFGFYVESASGVKQVVISLRGHKI